MLYKFDITGTTFKDVLNGAIFYTINKDGTRTVYIKTASFSFDECRSEIDRISAVNLDSGILVEISQDKPVYIPSTVQMTLSATLEQTK